MKAPTPEVPPQVQASPWRRRLIVAAAILLPAAAVLALLAYGFTREPRYIPTPLIAKPAPPFSLTRFNGGVLRLEDLRGKVVFLNFWASWCVPCRAEARTLEAAWQKYKDEGVVFVGVNIQDKEPDARAFLEEFGITYPNVIDQGNRVAIDYGVWGIPETFFINGEGRITYKHVGEIGWPTITSKLDEALRGVVSASEGRGDYRSTR
jgi:cytochrome c biogenesis protein CcmG/thiol:disulfide interchange protein DsbE